MIDGKVHSEDLQSVWFRQAQLDADRGVIECRMCHKKSGLDRTVTLWRDGNLVFALCDACAATHDILFKTTDQGIEIRAKFQKPIHIHGACS